MVRIRGLLLYSMGDRKPMTREPDVALLMTASGSLAQKNLTWYFSKVEGIAGEAVNIMEMHFMIQGFNSSLSRKVSEHWSILL